MLKPAFKKYLAAAAFLLPAAALASSTDTRMDGSVDWTAISGDTGAKSKIVGTGTDIEGVMLIGWAETSDNPCQFQVKRKTFVGQASELYERNLCGKDNRIGKTVERTGKHEYITAIQVCTTDKKDPTDNKLKGLKAWGRILDVDDASLSKEYGPDEAKHTHCKKWKKKIACKSGYVANKIKVYFNTNRYGKDYATGMALGCREVITGTHMSK